MFRGTVRTIHFVGIGGIGMSGIAEVLLNQGFRVTGSDAKASAAVERLRGFGAVVHLGHAPSNLGDADVVVRSSAVGEDNLEIRAALEAGIPVIRRAEMLAELMRLKDGIAVAGSHGKTTTTSMIASCLAQGDLDPTVVIGGRLDILGGSNAKLGQGRYLVAEADESDGTFMMLSPVVSVITNIDPEHLDHYGTVEVLERSFVEFANKVPFYGFTVLCLDHPRVQALISEVRRRVITYGFARRADVRATHVEPNGVGTRFHAAFLGEDLGEFTLRMPGQHNVQNALGAIAVAREIGVPTEAIRQGLAGFTGVQRRFTLRGEAGGVVVVDDYAHHPVEIEATLAAAESAFPDRRVIAVFQPHRFSRVQALWSEFCGAFFGADEVLVLPVYAAGEHPVPAVDHPTIGAAMRERGHRGVQVVESLDDATDRLAEMARPGDVVITLGAGNVNAICDRLLQRLGAGA